MVFLSQTVLMAKGQVKSFLDNIRIYVRGGGGGQGLPRYGGRGGRGGHVYVVGSKNMTLKKLIQQNPTKRFVAKSGTNSRVRALLGEPGKDIEIPVPCGVCVNTDSGRTLGEINTPEDRVLIARGGTGGCLENNFQGMRGLPVSVRLDLKLIADIGLVGFPNAGKSTLLSAISRAVPKIAAYPFTTITPQLGVMVFPDRRQISMADLPGLIEGAHLNIGMGHNFLKHVERTKLLLFMVDIHGFRLSMNHPQRTALETILLLNKELELYKDELMNKPAVLALNKMDIDGADEKLDEIMEQLNNLEDHLDDVNADLRPKQLVKFDDIIAISAKRRVSTEKLKARLRELLDVYADMEMLADGTNEHSLEVVNTQLTEQFGQKTLV
ncbi:GTP-binding protein 10 [Lamellibrachia satsuma]|nr:GTP-binding protein 10 [Lamellibrachia satsuma]